MKWHEMNILKYKYVEIVLRYSTCINDVIYLLTCPTHHQRGGHTRFHGDERRQLVVVPFVSGVTSPSGGCVASLSQVSSLWSGCCGDWKQLHKVKVGECGAAAGGFLSKPESLLWSLWTTNSPTDIQELDLWLREHDVPSTTPHFLSLLLHFLSTGGYR